MIRATTILVAAGFLVTPTLASAQSWEIEGHVGGAGAASISSATTATPPLGPSILTASPSFPGRQAPSWFFGDGASQLNGVASALKVPDRVTPLDTAFRSLGSGTLMGGVRLVRRLNDRWFAEVSLDVLAGSGSDVSALRTAAASAASSFKTVFPEVLATGPLVGASVDATSSVAGGGGRDLALTGALRWHFAPKASWSPYLTVGGGLLSRSGSLAAATLDGHYQFSIFGVAPINESDHVVLRYASTSAPVVVAGAGLAHAMGKAWALNVDVRVLIGSNDTALRLDASPSTVTGTPAASIELDTFPALQFSNSASTGRQSTLGGSLSGFSVVSGGISARTLVTVGLARRF